MFIDVPYWTQLATDAVYSLEQALESKIIGDQKEEEPIDNQNESWVRNLSDQVIFHVSLGYNLANHHQVSQPWWTEIPEKKNYFGCTSLS